MYISWKSHGEIMEPLKMQHQTFMGGSCRRHLHELSMNSPWKPFHVEFLWVNMKESVCRCRLHEPPMDVWFCISNSIMNVSWPSHERFVLLCKDIHEPIFMNGSWGQELFFNSFQVLSLKGIFLRGKSSCKQISWFWTLAYSYSPYSTPSAGCPPRGATLE